MADSKRGVAETAKVFTHGGSQEPLSHAAIAARLAEEV